MQRSRKATGEELASLVEHQDGNQLGVESGMIAGLKKSIYNSADFATLVVASYAPTTT